MEQINSILKSHGYQNLDYGICGRGGESAPGGLMAVLIVLKKILKNRSAIAIMQQPGNVCVELI